MNENIAVYLSLTDDIRRQKAAHRREVRRGRRLGYAIILSGFLWLAFNLVFASMVGGACQWWMGLFTFFWCVGCGASIHRTTDGMEQTYAWLEANAATEARRHMELFWSCS